MMEAKPLNPQQRLKMEDLLTLNPDYADGFSVADIQALLSAERYWREAVKHAPDSVDVGIHNYSAYCVFCNATRNGEGYGPHEPDCPWLRAQEEG